MFFLLSKVTWTHFKMLSTSRYIIWMTRIRSHYASWQTSQQSRKPIGRILSRDRFNMQGEGHVTSVDFFSAALLTRLPLLTCINNAASV